MIVELVRKRIEDRFGPKEVTPENIHLDKFARLRLEELSPFFSQRRVEITNRLDPTPPIRIPSDSLRKVFDGLVKNAIENTPDGGKVEIIVRRKEDGTELVVRDWGVGITEEDQRRIFEGFFTTQDTMAYSSKRPFQFNAGGKGADLLRMKVFSERYNFRINMTSSRCPCLPREADVCPGAISACPSCRVKEDCYESGGTTFTLFFLPAP